MQEGSAQPCGCDAGAGHVCQWHTSELKRDMASGAVDEKRKTGTYYDDRDPRMRGRIQVNDLPPHAVGCVQRGDFAPATETYPCDVIGYTHVDDHGAITPTVAMTTTAVAPSMNACHIPEQPLIGKIEQLTVVPGVNAHKTWRLQSKIPALAPVTTVPNYDHVLMGSPFTVKDSGARQEFASGMVRDTAEGKIDYTSVLDGPMLVRWAEHLTKAKQKYPDVAPGVANWTLATGDAELDRFRKSAFRHFIQWMRGDVDEDHAAALFFNVNGAEYVKGRR